MPRSRLFMLMLAALLIAQSVLGNALHRCHDGMQLMTLRDVPVMLMQRDTMPCHDQAGANDATEKNADIGNAPAPHGFCTCSIAHCTPGLISQFELPSTPSPVTTTALYTIVIPAAPTETLLRPPISLS